MNAMTDLSIDSLTRCTPRNARRFTTKVLSAGNVPFIKSSPGMGKSTIVRSITNDANLELIDHRASTSTPEDFTGLPEFYEDAQGIRRARFCPFDIFPTENTPLPAGRAGWVLFLDEFNSAPRSVQAASYKLILDRMVGQHKLHPMCFIILAGNNMDDGAIVEEVGTALQSRVIHVNMIHSFDEWLEDVAIPQKYDPRIIAYLSANRSSLNDFNPEHVNDTFACPRTWEFMHNMTKGEDIVDADIPLYAGTVGAGEASSFVQFSKVFGNIPSVQDILADPTATKLPMDGPSRWAVSAQLLDAVDDQNFEGMSTYMQRLPIDFKILFYRAIPQLHPSLRHHPAMRKAMVEISNRINPKAL